MGLLAGTLYDPVGAVTEVTTAASVMTAMDTTNLRLTFTVPPNGAVLVRIRGTVHGATTMPQILLGVLEGATVKGRVVPVGGVVRANATAMLTQEALFVVPGLTPGSSLTWDAAWGTETLLAATGIKYGGPDDATGNNAFGGLVFEIYDAPNLAGAKLYDPAVAVSKATDTLIAMTAFDTTNLRITFVAQTTRVLVRLKTNYSGATTFPAILLGVLDGATVKGRQAPVGGNTATNLTTSNISNEASFVITGLTRGTTYNYDAAYGVETVIASTNIHYGGPDDTVANNAWGAFGYEIWYV